MIDLNGGGHYPPRHCIHDVSTACHSQLASSPQTHEWLVPLFWLVVVVVAIVGVAVYENTSTYDPVAHIQPIVLTPATTEETRFAEIEELSGGENSSVWDLIAAAELLAEREPRWR